MYSNILVPLALDHGIAPQTLAIATALCSPGGTLTALHVHEAPEGAVSSYLDQDMVQAGLDRARALLDRRIADLPADAPPVTAVLVSGHSARTIIDYANDKGIDCIVVGSHKPGLRDYFLGSTAARVVRHALCAVHVHRNDT